MRWDTRFTGLRSVPEQGPAIIAANHVGFLDFAFIGAGADRRGRLVRFLARSDAFDHWLGGPLLRVMRHIPVDREGDASVAYAAAEHALRAGRIVGIHPEGAMSASFVPQPAKSGAARLAIDTGAPLIPVAVWGSQRILARGRHRFPRNVVVTVDYGTPIIAAPEDDAASVTERLMGAIARMVERAAARYPQRPRDASDRWWVPLHLGGTAPSVEASLEKARTAAEHRRWRRAQAAGRANPPLG